ncbi:P-loop NTPase family protein [Allosalinactinospora lopnorensis]|uniref:hypothetical protein n=1 Tax=Allosalinactinospora lopnorensis TaxID=1352348 RepID=UPI000623CF15|nr:hypothetical protein [Allosalinactinospora lopnorensis]
MTTPGAEGERPPVLLFTGVDGSGKTTLLKQTGGALNQKTPWAFVDCAEYSPTDLPEFLTEIKVQLSRHCRGFGRLRFPRLELGLAVTKEKVDFTSQKQAFRQLSELVENQIRHRPKAVEEILDGIVGDMVGEVFTAQTTLPAKLLRAPTERLVTAVASRALSSPSVLRREQSWYGHRDQRLPYPPIDELAQLNRWAHTPQRLRQRDKRLVEALLADVRVAFDRGRSARSRRYNCVILLDNAHTDLGRAVLEHLQKLRRHFQTAGLAAEPLLVVASSRKPLPGDALEQHPLPEFTDAETDWLASHLPEEADPRLPKLIQLLTGGYPAAAALLVNTACRQSPAAEGGIGALLTAEVDDDAVATATVEDRLCHNLVEALLKQPEHRPFPDEALEPLTTCAAARTQEEAEWLAARYSDSGLVDPDLLWQSGLWDEERATAAHALLRRLLLRRLARRGAGQWDWETVQRGLRDRCREDGDVAGELYYALAGGELPEAARRLTEYLPGNGIAQTWLSLLLSVAEAPRMAPDTAPSTPFERQIELTRSMAGESPPHLVQVARVVAGLWLANDRCTGPERADLHREIALDYRRIAVHGDQPVELHNQADRHDELARYWS